MTTDKLTARVINGLDGIMVELSDARGTKFNFFRPGTPPNIQALVFASQGYGTPEAIYAVLAPPQGVTEPYEAPV